MKTINDARREYEALQERVRHTLAVWRGGEEVRPKTLEAVFAGVGCTNEEAGKLESLALRGEL